MTPREAAQLRAENEALRAENAAPRAELVIVRRRLDILIDLSAGQNQKLDELTAAMRRALERRSSGKPEKPNDEDPHGALWPEPLGLGVNLGPLKESR